MGITSGRSTSYVCPLVTMVAEPLARTFFSQSVRSPYGRAIKKLSSCRAATTGVSYVRPDRRPTWRTTDVLDLSVPADRRASGRVARVNRRKAFWIELLMPQRSHRLEGELCRRAQASAFWGSPQGYPGVTSRCRVSVVWHRHRA